MKFHFDGAVAEMYGVDGAVFISRLQFWIEKNAANDRHWHEGRYWTYNSLRAMEKLFPFWSRRQIERIVKNLRDKGVLLTANYARDTHDRTLPSTRANYPFHRLVVTCHQTVTTPCHQTVTSCHRTVK